MTKKTATMAMTLKAAGLLPLLALTACAGSQRFVGGAPQSYGQPSLPPAPAISAVAMIPARQRAARCVASVMAALPNR